MYTIEYADTIYKKDLRTVDTKILQTIRQQIQEKLTISPDRFGKPLRTSLKGYRRLRIGQYRIIYTIVQTTVRIVFIGKKPAVYANFLKKIHS